MADVAVENNETPVVEKVIDEVDPKDVEESPNAENGAAETVAIENGAEASEVDDVTAAVDDLERIEESVVSGESNVDENGDEASKEANGDSTDSAPAETVKRKVVEPESKLDENSATPEKKAKLDEATKDDVQNGSEATEVAA